MFKPPLLSHAEVVAQLQSYELQNKRTSTMLLDSSMAIISQQCNGGYKNNPRGKGRGSTFNSRIVGFLKQTRMVSTIQETTITLSKPKLPMQCQIQT